MEDMKKQAKLKVLKDLRSEMSNMMGDDIMEGMKKVTVAAPDAEGLEEGLDKAKDMAQMAEEVQAEEDMDMEYGDEEEMSKEEVMEMIAELQAKLESMEA